MKKGRKWNIYKNKTESIQISLVLILFYVTMRYVDTRHVEIIFKYLFSINGNMTLMIDILTYVLNYKIMVYTKDKVKSEITNRKSIILNRNSYK